VNPVVKRVYDGLPAPLQNLVVSGFGWWLDRNRYGGRFPEYRRLLEESQWWSPAQLRDWQDERLRAIVAQAFAEVPFYQRRFAEYGLSVGDVQTQDDLHKLPVLTRKDIIDNFEDLVARNVDRRSLRIGHTSGTTGSPLEVLHDADVTQITYAMLDRQYRWAGVNFGHGGDRVAVLRGNVIVPLEQKRAPFWRHNRYHNQLLLSAFHMSSANLPEYLAEIRRFGPAALDGYPSTLYVLARFVLASGEKLPLKAVISASETLYDFQREAIEAAFQCRVFDYLAAAERVVFSAECDRHEGHHVCLEYGVSEFLDDDGAAVPAGQPGKLVCTSLHNMGMPLIRYVSNDVSAMKTVACSCGRGLPLMEDVTTKAEDILALSDGRMISPSVLTHPFKPMHTVEASQIVQDDYDSIEIRVVPGPGYSEADTRHLLREFRQRLGEGVHVRVTQVPELERSRSGKFKWVISRVSGSVQVP
jgi:phenylacetate-CoA ligase